jgi:hypothetical protein
MLRGDVGCISKRQPAELQWGRSVVSRAKSRDPDAWLPMTQWSPAEYTIGFGQKYDSSAMTAGSSAGYRPLGSVVSLLIHLDYARG